MFRRKYKETISAFLIFMLSLTLSPLYLSQNIFADGIPGAWGTTTSLGIAEGGNQSIIYNGVAYVVGGFNNSITPITNTYYGSISNNGAIASWTAGTALSTALDYGGAAAEYSHIYMLGGYNNTSDVNTVSIATIASNGSFGSWTTTTALPQAISKFAYTQTTAGYIYTLGGTTTTSNAQAITNVYYTQPNSTTGAISSWSSATSLPTALILSSATVSNGYMYVVGGVQTSGTVVNTVYYAPINSNGSLGTWNTTTALPSVERSNIVSTYKGYIYVSGGYNGTTYLNTNYYSKINSDGTIGPWTTGPTLTTAFSTGSGGAYNSYLYTFGGYDGSTLNAVYYSLLGFGLQNTGSQSSNYNNLAPATSMGGCPTTGTSAKYSLNCTIGQNTPSGISTSTHFILKSGFQYFDYGSSAPYISFTMNSSAINFGSIVANSFSSGSNTINITTDAVHGYNLYAQENNDLQNTSNASVHIPSFTGSDPSTATSWTSPTVNGLGYNVAGSDAATDFTSNTMFRGFDSANSHSIASITHPTQTTGGDTLTFTYQVSPSSGVAAGTYTNTITYTIIGIY